MAAVVACRLSCSIFLLYFAFFFFFFCSANKGVSPNQRDVNNSSPLDMCERRGASHKDFTTYLTHITQPTKRTPQRYLWDRAGVNRVPYLAFLGAAVAINVGLWLQLSPEDGLYLHAPFYLAQLLVWILYLRLRARGPDALPRRQCKKKKKKEEKKRI